jgi:hypothetical protein
MSDTILKQREGSLLVKVALPAQGNSIENLDIFHKRLTELNAFLNSKVASDVWAKFEGKVVVSFRVY